MGIIKQGILGGFSGKVGKVVGGAWKGIDYMRSLATSVANPKTQPQVTVRSNFSTIAKIMASANTLLKKSNWRLAKKQSAFNAAVRINYDNAIVNDEIDMEKLSFGEFSRKELTNLRTVFENDSTNLSLKLTWENDADGIVSFDDDMVAVVIVRISAEGKFEETIVNYNDAKREDCEVHVHIGLVETFARGDTFYAYAGAGHNPQKPSETIKIPAKNVIKFRAMKTI